MSKYDVSSQVNSSLETWEIIHNVSKQFNSLLWENIPSYLTATQSTHTFLLNSYQQSQNMYKSVVNYKFPLSPIQCIQVYSLRKVTLSAVNDTLLILCLMNDTVGGNFVYTSSFYLCLAEAL